MPVTDKKVFVFSTTGNFRDRNHKLIKEKLANKECTVVGEFSCLGEFGFFGISLKNKGHPDEKDLENARTFAEGLLNV